MITPSLTEQFGQIDIYLFDQILRGRITPGMRILDVGCGGGRNLVYFLQQGFEVFAADEDPKAIASTRHLAAILAPNLPASNFHCEPIEALSFPNSFADLVVSSAVSFGLGRTFMHFRKKKRMNEKAQSQARSALALRNRPAEPESKNKSKRKRQQLEKETTKH